MSNNDDKLLSAQVVARFSADAQAVMEEFQRAGFEVGPLFANSFSISAVANRFESYFNATFDSSSDEGIIVKTNEGAVRADVPLESVSQTVRDKIQEIVFSKPPDFGPSGGY